MEEHRQVSLIISPEVRAILDERRLVDEDLQKTIFAAEQTGGKFVHPREEDRFLAGMRPYFVTVWVDYTTTPQGYVVHTAYKHRVKVTGGEAS
jgi:hypothetical protein